MLYSKEGCNFSVTCLKVGVFNMEYKMCFKVVRYIQTEAYAKGMDQVLQQKSWLYASSL